MFQTKVFVKTFTVFIIIRTQMPFNIINLKQIKQTKNISLLMTCSSLHSKSFHHQTTESKQSNLNWTVFALIVLIKKLRLSDTFVSLFENKGLLLNKYFDKSFIKQSFGLPACTIANGSLLNYVRILKAVRKNQLSCPTGTLSTQCLRI